MKSLFLLKLRIIWYWPRYIFMNKKEKVLFCLDYLFPNRYAFAYAVFQTSMESGNFTNTNTVEGNNPFNFVYSPNWGVPTVNRNGWSSFGSIASACWVYYKWVTGKPNLKQVMIDAAPNAWFNNEYGQLDGTAAATYFAAVSQQMIAYNYATGTQPANYNQAVFAYYTAAQDQNGSVKIPTNVLAWYWRIIIPIIWFSIIACIIWMCRKGKKKKSSNPV